MRNFINGQFVEPVGGKYLDNIEPATGKPYSLVPDSDSRDVELAVAAAVRRCRADREIESFPASCSSGKAMVLCNTSSSRKRNPWTSH
jgi:acyl-CoA reductase-like NAD-dependent aldehyde dehydrogenase